MKKPGFARVFAIFMLDKIELHLAFPSGEGVKCPSSSLSRTPKAHFIRFGEPLIAQRRQTHSISLRCTQGDGDAKSNPKGDATCGIGISGT